MVLHYLVAFLVASPLLIAEPAVQREQEPSVRVLRERYLNQEIIVLGHEGLRGTLLMWNKATKAGDRYEMAGLLNSLPLSYRGQEARVIAVQLNQLELERSGNRPNALGEVIAPDDRPNPYFDLVVQFDDGTIGMMTSYPRSISGVRAFGVLGFEPFILVSERDRHAQLIERNLPSLIGQVVYAAGHSKLYDLSATLDQLTDTPLKRPRSPLSIPLFQSLTITAAQYKPEYDAVVIKVKLPNGQEALAISSYRVELNKDEKDSFLGRISGELLAAIPAKLTKAEVEAIQNGAIFKGMSKDAVFYALGVADKENDWGQGGKQRIYAGRFYVYIGSNDLVSDWQVIGR